MTTDPKPDDGVTPPPPRPRKRALVRQQILWAGLGTFGLLLAVTWPVVGLVVAAMGYGFTYVMVRSGRRLEAVGVYLDALRHLYAGDPVAATRVLDDAEATGVPLASIPHAIALVRTDVALQEGRVQEAIAFAQAGVATRPDRIDQATDRALARELRALAAIAHATAGDVDEARALVVATELDIASSGHALARASLAACTLLAREGKRAELAERLERGRRVLDVAGSTKERALARAFARLAATPAPSVYRRAAAPVASEQGDWIAAAAGDAAAFLPPSPTDAERTLRAPKTRPRPPPSPWMSRTTGRRVLALVGLSAAVTGVLLGGRPLFLAMPEVVASNATMLTVLGFLALLGGFVLVRVRGAVRGVDRLVVAEGLWARGDTKRARRTWDELSRDKSQQIAATASLALGSLAYREGDLAGALTHASRGLDQLTSQQAVPGASLHLLPELTALWARARAGASPSDARAAAASLADYSHLTRARYRIEMAARVAERDWSAAADWAARAKRDTTLDAFDEVLADAVRLVTAGPSLAATERTRIARAVAEPDKTAFLAGVAPELLTAARLAAGADESLPPVDAHEDADDSPERAAQKAEEAAIAEAEAEHEVAHRPFTTRAT